MDKIADFSLVGGERADATDHCLAGIARLANEVKDASQYLPAYDQRTYSEVRIAVPPPGCQEEWSLIEAQHNRRLKRSQNGSKRLERPSSLGQGSRSELLERTHPRHPSETLLKSPPFNVSKPLAISLVLPLPKPLRSPSPLPYLLPTSPGRAGTSVVRTTRSPRMLPFANLHSQNPRQSSSPTS